MIADINTMEPKSNFLNINGFNLHYEVFEGLVDNDTLFIHGNLASNVWWYPAVVELQKRAATSGTAKKGKLILGEWRGCGLSKGLKTEDEINFENFGDDFLELIEKLGLKDVQVVGHSTGGLIAMYSILKNSQPFKDCVLLDSIGPKGIVSPIPVDDLLGHFETMSQSEDISNMTIGATIQGVDQTSAYFKTLAKKTFEVDKPVWIGVPRTLCLEIDITDRMSELKLPVLILHGENDMVLPKEGSEEMAEQIENSTLKILKGFGHSPNVEDPVLFVNELESFWSSKN